MEIYKVGGAVRDRLLGRVVKETDWVVVGATPKAMLDKGYKPVGKAFPVFLHPETAEEYALARTEKKISPGYTGFSCDAAPTVTLEEDLLRRDLTINAMAETSSGNIIDPYGGQADLKAKVLRHVSPAFVEDPVRVLRIARFAARYAEYGFSVAPETMALMKTMVAKGEVEYLVPERVSQELFKALMEKTPSAFFQVLQACGAFSVVFPGMVVDALLPTLDKSQGVSTKERFALLMYQSDVDSLCQRLKVPKDYKELAGLVARYQKEYAESLHLSAEKLVSLLEKLDAFRREPRFLEFLTVCQCIHGDKQANFLKELFSQLQKISLDEILQQGYRGSEIAEQLQQRRIELVKKL